MCYLQIRLHDQVQWSYFTYTRVISTISLPLLPQSEVNNIGNYKKMCTIDSGSSTSYTLHTIHPKISCHSKPMRPLFIFWTQMKIFLIKSESFLALHRKQCNWNILWPRNVVRTALKKSTWHQWFNCNFTKPREYFLCAKKTKRIV